MRNRVALFSCVLFGCTGDIVTPAGGFDLVEPDPQQPMAAPWQIPPLPESCAALPAGGLRLLTNAQIDRTLAAVFGRGTVLPALLPPETRVDGFTENGAREVSQLWVDQLDQGSGQLAQTVSSQVEQSLSCTGSETEEACVRRTLSRLSAQLFRRPVASGEVDDLWALYQAGRANGGTRAQGLTLAVQGMVGAPSFAYRSEVGVADGATRVLEGWEIAQALSYNLTGGPPDAELNRLAEGGTLVDPAVREQQVERLMKSPGGRDRIGQFAAEWLGIENVTNLGRDQERFPAYTSTIRGLVAEETRTFVTEVLTGTEPTAKTLLAGEFTYVENRLAEYYGLSARPGSAVTRVSLQGTERRGVLTQGAFLVAFSHENETSPIKRGVAVRERVLCLAPPPPPPNIIPAVGSPDEPRTTRDRYAQHTSNPTCAGCHKLIDPPGFALEGFDAVGQHRTTENGFPIDTTGELLSAGDASGAFRDAAELAQNLAGSQQAADCLVTQVATFHLGRRPDPVADACTVQGARHRALTKGGDVVEAMKAIAASDSFVRRAAQ